MLEANNKRHFVKDISCNTQERKMMSKKVLVVGANFVNKGAQSMLFIVTDELRKRYKDCEVYFACNGEKYKEEDYCFKKLLYIKQCQDLALGEHVNHYANIKMNIKNLLRLILRGSDDLFRTYDAKKIVPQLDLIIDVSGYALADISRPIEHEYYLDNIRIAKKFNIPIILMPQSFGPFNYSEENRYLMDEMKELLQYPVAIYAREEEGYIFLQDNFGLTNLRHSSDLVLQNRGIIRSNVCTDSYKTDVPEFESENNVAIIPNYHCFTKEFEDHSFDLYRQIIRKLLEADKEVYVFRHASFDLDICKKIVEMFADKEHVHLIEREFDCIEYDELIKKFEFIICSRYHGCVHAYKNLVPNIILGWAVKYRELAKLLGQEKYMFNVLSNDCDVQAILDSVEYMLANIQEEKKQIHNRLDNIQTNNCFKLLDEIDW